MKRKPALRVQAFTLHPATTHKAIFLLRFYLATTSFFVARKVPAVMR